MGDEHIYRKLVIMALAKEYPNEISPCWGHDDLKGGFIYQSPLKEWELWYNVGKNTKMVRLKAASSQTETGEK